MSLRHLCLPLKHEPQTQTIRQLFIQFQVTSVAIKQNKLYAQVQKAVNLEELSKTLQEKAYPQFQNDRLRILGSFESWQIQNSICPFRLTSKDLLDPHFSWHNLQLNNHPHDHTAKIDNYQLLEQSTYRHPKNATSSVDNPHIQNTEQMTQGLNNDQNFGLFQVGLCEQTTVIELDFEPQTENKNEESASNEQTIPNIPLAKIQQATRPHPPQAPQNKVLQSCKAIQKSSFASLIQSEKDNYSSVIIQTRTQHIDQTADKLNSTQFIASRAVQTKEVEKQVQVLSSESNSKELTPIGIFVFLVLLLWIILMAYL